MGPGELYEAVVNVAGKLIGENRLEVLQWQKALATRRTVEGDEGKAVKLLSKALVAQRLQLDASDPQCVETADLFIPVGGVNRF